MADLTPPPRVLWPPPPLHSPWRACRSAAVMFGTLPQSEVSGSAVSLSSPPSVVLRNMTGYHSVSITLQSEAAPLRPPPSPLSRLPEGWIFSYDSNDFPLFLVRILCCPQILSFICVLIFIEATKPVWSTMEEFLPCEESKSLSYHNKKQH